MEMRLMALFLGVVGALILARGTHAADGAALWEKNCASCHGKGGKGDTKAGEMVKVRDLTAPDVRATLNAEVVRKAVEEGVTDKATGKSRMKAYKDKLSKDEIDAVVTHTLGLGGTQ
jgi:mono/diheme cytochrome c family protein